MERKKNILYFQPDEKEKFLRAISLIAMGLGRSEEIRRESVEHERAHIDKVEELGYQHGIEWYTITMNTKCKYGFNRKTTGFRAEVRCSKDISDIDLIKIALAPKNPSIQDFLSASLNLELLKNQ